MKNLTISTFLEKLVKKETILCISNNDIKLKNGFNPIDEHNLIELDEMTTWFGPREVLETNMDYRQIIPYCIIKLNDFKYIMYERPVTGNEQRLHGLKSIGFGGHVNLKDVPIEEGGIVDEDELTGSGFETMACMRELHEELPGILIHVQDIDTIGYIYFSNDSDAADVNKVHLGIVYIVDVRCEEDEIKSEITEIGKCELVTKDELIKYCDDMELWSKEIVTTLFAE